MIGAHRGSLFQKISIGDIVTGTKAPPSAVEDQDLYTIILIGQLRDLIELLIGLGVQGVQNVRLIECDDTESRFLFIDECFVHPFPLLSFIAEN